MLTAFRSVFPEAPLATDDTERGCADADAAEELVGGGNSVEDGVRRPILGVLVSDLAGVDGVCRPDDFRVFATGRAGRAMVGGPLEYLGGFGSAVAILLEEKLPNGSFDFKERPALSYCSAVKKIADSRRAFCLCWKEKSSHRVVPSRKVLSVQVRPTTLLELLKRIP